MPEVPTGVLISDETLVDLARHGDRPACEELFRRHWETSYHVAYRLLGHEQDTLDAVQEALLKAFKNLKNFDGRSGFKTWLIRIVTNAALDSGRRRRRRLTLGLANGENNGSDPIFDDDPARDLHRQDLRQRLDAALDRLAPMIRATFVLFAEAGLSYKEIAEIQEIPQGTVMSRLHYARQKLQTYLNLEGIEGI